MSKNTTTQIIPLQAPVMGLDLETPALQVEQPYSPLGVDVLCDGREAKVRPLHSQIGTETPLCLASFEALSQVVFANQATASVRFFSASGSGTATAGLLLWDASCNYNSRVFLAYASGAYSWDGTTWATAFTGAAGGTYRGCCVYNNRYYQAQASTLYFAPTVGAVSGALSSFSLASYVGTGELVSCASLSAINNLNAQDFLVVTTSGGDVLYFQGDFPGAANWRLATRAKIPAENTSFYVPHLIPANGDAYLFSGRPLSLISARELLQSGYLGAEKVSPLASVVKTLRDLGVTGVSCCFEPSLNRLILCLYDSTLAAEALYRFIYPDLNLGRTAAASPIVALYACVYLETGAVSFHSAPDQSSPYVTLNTVNGLVALNTGAIFNIMQVGTELWNLFGSLGTEQIPASYPFIQFPFLSLPDTTIRSTMAYPVLYSPTPTATLSCSIYMDSDDLGLESSQSMVSEYASDSFSLTTDKPFSHRFKMPIAGEGFYLSPVIKLPWVPGASVKSISLQVEPGGPL